MHHSQIAEQINATFIDKAEHINVAMPMYNMIEYSDNYSDTSGSLWQFKRDEQLKENNGNLSDVSQIIHHLLNTNQTLLVPFQMEE